MVWRNLTDYRCPNDGKHLRLIKLRRIFLCESCDFVITTQRRAEIAEKYPRPDLLGNLVIT